MAGSKISTGDRVNDDIIIIQFAYIQIILILAYHYSLCNQGKKHIFLKQRLHMDNIRLQINSIQVFPLNKSYFFKSWYSCIFMSLIYIIILHIFINC